MWFIFTIAKELLQRMMNEVFDPTEMTDIQIQSLNIVQSASTNLPSTSVPLDQNELAFTPTTPQLPAPTPPEPTCYPVFKRVPKSKGSILSTTSSTSSSSRSSLTNSSTSGSNSTSDRSFSTIPSVTLTKMTQVDKKEKVAVDVHLKAGKDDKSKLIFLI